MDRNQPIGDRSESIQLPIGENAQLTDDIAVPQHARGMVIFAHGSGSSRLSPRNQYVARALRDRGFATILFDLLTPAEELIDRGTGEFRFDVELLAERLIAVTDWTRVEGTFSALPLGYFGASTGAAAALIAAARRPEVVRAIVSRGGRPDLAIPWLPEVRAATLLIVGGNDAPVITFNQEALSLLRVEARLEIVPGATHLFEEPGALDQVVQLAGRWFDAHLSSP